MTRFVDEAQILVQAGRGGKGCRSYYKDKWTRYPIPDGGNGGAGGDVLVSANPQLTTLLDFQTQRHFRGTPGGNASSKRKQGANGKACLVRVPLGTILWDAVTGDLIRDLTQSGEEVIVARGGAGGIGNAKREKAQPWGPSRAKRIPFQPQMMEPAPGEERHLRLELKLLADVGIVGLPNAGKSTLISQISQARPKVAPFPFTTTSPVLGAVELASGKRFVALDVPGLIEGAHRGRGLGLGFLRHIERTKLLVHLIDMAGVDGRDPAEDWKVLNTELKAYGADVGAKPQILVANKMDLPESKKNLTRFRKETKTRPIPISAQTGEGIPDLLEKISTQLKRMSKG